MGKKAALKLNREEGERIAESGRVMAEESRRKRIISEKALQLQEKDIQEKLLLREERIMSRNVESLNGVARHSYELKQK